MRELTGASRSIQYDECYDQLDTYASKGIPLYFFHSNIQVLFISSTAYKVLGQFHALFISVRPRVILEAHRCIDPVSTWALRKRRCYVIILSRNVSVAFLCLLRTQDLYRCGGDQMLVCFCQGTESWDMLKIIFICYGDKLKQS